MSQGLYLCYCLSFVLRYQKRVQETISATHFFTLFIDLKFAFDDFLISTFGTAIQCDFLNSVPAVFSGYCSGNMFHPEKCFFIELLKVGFKLGFERER